VVVVMVVAIGAAMIAAIAAMRDGDSGDGTWRKRRDLVDELRRRESIRRAVNSRRCVKRQACSRYVWLSVTRIAAQLTSCQSWEIRCQIERQCRKNACCARSHTLAR
jgi:hypothetical protein